MRRGQEDLGAVDWLTRRGVWQPGATHSDNMARCAEFRSRMTRLGAPPGKQWAQDIVGRYQAGERLPDYAVKLAMSALDITQPLIHPPKRPVVRPDAKERQAGDVDVGF